MSTLLSKAISIATWAHNGQADKCNEPYILHPLRVMLAMQSATDRAVAVLHDVIEDTVLTEKDLLDRGLPAIVVDAVEAMSRVKGEPYLDYLMRVRKNEISKRVKIADIKDNSSPRRLYKLEPETVARLSKKYSAALQYLERE